MGREYILWQAEESINVKRNKRYYVSKTEKLDDQIFKLVTLEPCYGPFGFIVGDHRVLLFMEKFESLLEEEKYNLETIGYRDG